MDAGAICDPPYRYLLWRTLSPLVNRGTVLFIMMNPSVATATEDDPTVRRVMGFADMWGYRTLEVANIFALRSTDPKGLLDVADPVGPENDHHIRMAASRADLVIAAWGIPPVDGGRIDEVLDLIGKDVFCLGHTMDGHPRHPLYIPKATKPLLYRRPDRIRPPTA